MESTWLKIPKKLFINISDKDYNERKCILCNFVPLKPIVIIPEASNNKNFDANILCKECYLNSNKSIDILEVLNISKNESENLESFIGNKIIKCIKNDYGCKWKGPFSNLEKHLNDECAFIQVKCINDGCKEIRLRKDLDSHLILCDKTANVIGAKCKLCNNEFNIKDIPKHLNNCPEITVECIKGCGKKLKKKEMKEHLNIICPVELVKCPFWDKGCKTIIKRKYLEDHYKLYTKNHQNFDEKYKELNNNINFGLEDYNNNPKKEKEFNNDQLSMQKSKLSINNREIKRELRDNSEDVNIFKNPKIFKEKQEKNIKEKKETNKKNNFYDNYIPFTENRIQFMLHNENINKKIFIFEREKIKYSGNYFNNLDLGKKYIILSQNSLDLKSITNFQFKIFPPFNEKSNNPSQLPWVAFGLYITKKGDNFDNIYFQNDKFFCMDLDSLVYSGGKKGSYDDVGKININGFITISIIPEENLLLIKDNYGLEFKFKIKNDMNSDIRLCFVFSGKDRAIINYNY